MRLNRTFVTYLKQREEEARVFDNLCLYEVRDLLVLHDPEGLYRGLREVYDSQHDAITRTIFDSTVLRLLSDLHSARGGPLWRRLVHVREAATKVASLELFLQHGWRVPKFRQLATHLPQSVSALLRRLLGVPLSEEQVRGAKAGIVPLHRRMRALLRTSKTGAAPELPTVAFAKLRAGDVEDFALQLRRSFERSWAVPVAKALGVPRSELYQQLPGLASYLASIHALPQDSATLRTLLQTAKADLLELIEALDTGRFFQPATTLRDQVLRLECL
jgi:hypothetical protein